MKTEASKKIHPQYIGSKETQKTDIRHTKQ